MLIIIGMIKMSLYVLINFRTNKELQLRRILHRISRVRFVHSTVDLAITSLATRRGLSDYTHDDHRRSPDEFPSAESSVLSRGIHDIGGLMVMC